MSGLPGRPGANALVSGAVQFVPVDLQEDGLSEPWAYGRWWIRDEPEIAVVVDGEDDALLSVVRLDPDALLPADPPITLTPPGWGADRSYEPADYLVASTALESVGVAAGEMAVLGSTTTPGGEASLVQIGERVGILTCHDCPFSPGGGRPGGAGGRCRGARGERWGWGGARSSSRRSS